MPQEQNLTDLIEVNPFTSHNPTAPKKKFSTNMPCDKSDDNVIIVHAIHTYE